MEPRRSEVFECARAGGRARNTFPARNPPKHAGGAATPSRVGAGWFSRRNGRSPVAQPARSCLFRLGRSLSFSFFLSVSCVSAATSDLSFLPGSFGSSMGSKVSRVLSSDLALLRALHAQVFFLLFWISSPMFLFPLLTACWQVLDRTHALFAESSSTVPPVRAPVSTHAPVGGPHAGQLGGAGGGRGRRNHRAEGAT